MDAIRRLVSVIETRWNEETREPLQVSIMGQTGVGKSSLLNALFKANLVTDPVKPGTTTIETRLVKGNDGHPIRFHDLPGIGESPAADTTYFKQYQHSLITSDVVIWATLADSRSFTFDRDALGKLLEQGEPVQQIALMSKIIFVLTKVDLLTPETPSPWILYQLKEKDEGVFETTAPIEALIDRKAAYFREAFIQPFQHLIKGQTYCPGKIEMIDERITYTKSDHKKSLVRYDGCMEEHERDQLLARYPHHADIIQRLYDNARVIPCSSRFKYNLDLLRRVMTDKLTVKAAGPFGGFLSTGPLDRIPYAEARRYMNIVIVPEEERIGSAQFDAQGG